LKSLNPVGVSKITFNSDVTCVAGFVPFGSPIVSNHFDWQYFYRQDCPQSKHWYTYGRPY